MKNIKPEHSKQILSKMCETIGIKYEDVNFEEPNWYQKHSWTSEQENEFKKWLGKFLVDNKYSFKGKYRGQNCGEYEAAKIIMNYGWSIK